MQRTTRPPTAAPTTPPHHAEAQAPASAPTKAPTTASAKASTQAAANAPAPFGPAAHNAWALTPEGVNLVRQPLRPKPVRLDAQPQPITIDLARSALIVVDMQNDFCHPEGWFAQKGISIRSMRRPIPVIARLLDAWRTAGAPVVWLNWGIRADRLNLSPTVQFKGKRTADGVGYAEASPLDRGRSLVAGEWGAEVVGDLAVAPGDITVFKHRLSGFWDNELDSLLRQQGITTLLFAGINTDRCVFSSLQDAGFLGYDCVLLTDACGTPSPAYVSRAIHFVVQQLHGFTATTAALLPALAALRPAAKAKALPSTSSHPAARRAAAPVPSRVPSSP